MSEQLFALFGLGFWIIIVLIVVKTIKAKRIRKNLLSQESIGYIKKTEKSKEEISQKIYKTLDKQKTNIKNEKDILRHQLDNNIRILNDCYELMSKTKNKETFSSRYNLALDKLEVLNKGTEYGIFNEVDYNKWKNKIDECFKLRVNEFHQDNIIAQAPIHTNNHTKISLLELEAFDEKSVPRNDDVNFKNINIPDYIKELLWIKGKNYNDNGINIFREPSLIDLDMEVSDNASILEYSDDIGYYPSYEKLTPKQRYIYLNWLNDITNNNIDIGYVFIFYYGLERHLLYGKYEKAFDIINKLRLYHKNNSFLSYSSDALLVAALIHKRPDLIEKIDLSTSNNDVSTFIVGVLINKYSAENIISMRKKANFTNDRYIKLQYDLFYNKLNEILMEKYGESFFPVKKEDFLKATSSFGMHLANYSLEFKERFSKAPDIMSNPEVCKSIFMILNEAHERVKLENKQKRSKANKNMSTQ